MAASNPTQFKDTFIALKPPSGAASDSRAADSAMQELAAMDIGLDGIDLTALDMTTTAEQIDFDGVTANLNAFREDDLVSSALLDGVDLGQYAAQIDTQLGEVEAASVRDYMANSEALVKLHDDIGRADGLLASMQQMLSGFQSHLKQISGEIRHLQDKSLSMNMELENQKAAEGVLSHFVEALAVDEELVSAISQAPMGKEYIHLLATLNAKMQLHQSLDAQSTAFQDVATTLLTLQNRATLRCRSFLIAQFNELGVPKTNISLKQQHLLLFKYFMTFIDAQSQAQPPARLKRSESYSSSLSSGSRFHEDIGVQLRGLYCELMAKVYMGHFRSYVQSLTRYRDTEVADRHSLLGCDVAKTGGLFSSKKSAAFLNKVFVLGPRAEVLSALSEPALVVQLIEATQRFAYEEVFRSFLRLLVDTAVNEHRFLLQFFHERSLFARVFDRVLLHLLEEFDAFRQSCYDSLALLLMLRVVERVHFELAQKQMTVLEAFLDKLTMAFWPRFNILFDDNVASIKQLEPTRYKLRLNTPHFATMRVASYMAAILALNAAEQQQILTDRIEQLRVAFTRMLQRFADGVEEERARLVWLINNYSVVVAAMHAHDVAQSATFCVALVYRDGAQGAREQQG